MNAKTATSTSPMKPAPAAPQAEHGRREQDRGHDAGRALDRLPGRGVRGSGRGQGQLAEPAELIHEEGPIGGADRFGGPGR